MKRTMIAGIIITCVGMAYLHFSSRVLHAVPNGAQLERAIQKGILLGNTVIQNKQADHWIDQFMWRFKSVSPTEYALIKAIAARQIGKYLIKTSNAVIIKITAKEKENFEGQRPPPMEME